MARSILLVCCLASMVLSAGGAMAEGGGDLARVRAQNAALTADAAAKAAELETLRAANLQSADQVRVQAAQLEQLRRQLAGVTNLANSCLAKNERLAAFAEDVLSDYRKITLGKIVSSREFLVGLGRVKLENLLQDREDRIRANRCDPRTDAAPPPKAGG